MSQPESTGDRDWISGAVVAVLATVGIALMMVLVANTLDPSEPDGDEQEPEDTVVDAEPEPTPSPRVSPRATPTPTPDVLTPAPTPAPLKPEPEVEDDLEATPPGADPTPEPDTPTDRQRRFVDLDGDGQEERITAVILADAVEVEVAGRNGGRYRAISSARGGSADDLKRLYVQDLNGDGVLEIATRQWVATSGESLAVWTQDDGELEPMIASGGCWDGSNVYGITGVLVEAGRIVATCERDETAPQLWPADVYEWRDGAWSYTRTLDNRPQGS